MKTAKKQARNTTRGWRYTHLSIAVIKPHAVVDQQLRHGGIAASNAGQVQARLVGCRAQRKVAVGLHQEPAARGGKPTRRLRHGSNTLDRRRLVAHHGDGQRRVARLVGEVDEPRVAAVCETLRHGSQARTCPETPPAQSQAAQAPCGRRARARATSPCPSRVPGKHWAMASTEITAVRCTTKTQSRHATTAPLANSP